MPSEHARLSPSSAHRWMTCTIAPTLEATMPEETSAFAEEGTTAHAWGEIKLVTYLSEGNYDKIKVADDASMDEYTSDYADYVIAVYEGAKAEIPDAQLHVEQRLDMSEWVPGCFGTADAVVVSDSTLHVIDLKYGRGVPVSAGTNAGDNPQLSLYAGGAFAFFSPLYDIDTVAVHIFQPRLNNISTATFKADDLLAWLEQTVKPAAEKAAAGDGEPVAGEHCRFCKVRRRCRARADWAQMLADKRKDAESRMLSEEEIAEILPTLDSITGWCKDIAEEAHERARNGHRIPGYKLVRGRSTRKVSDPDGLVERLHEAGKDDSEIYKPREVKTITELEKMLGTKVFGELSEGCIERPPGKISLVPETDKRPEYNAAAEDFEL